MRRSSIVCCVMASCAVAGISFMPACGGNGSSTFNNGSSSGSFLLPDGAVPPLGGSNGSGSGTTSGGELPDGGYICPTGLQCNVSCTGGGTTTVTGTVYDPAQKNPLYNIAVYVPAVPLQPLPKGVPTGADACSCGALFESGALTNTYTGVDGTFTLTNVPVGSQVPLVLQVGKWRRQVNINVTACTSNAQPDKSLSLPGTIAGGDTKVVEHGKADSMYITTTGIGRPLHGLKIDARSVRAGDKILLSGPIGDHGITILLARGELDLEADLHSDTRSVFPLVEALVKAAGPGVRWMRDPTRGGVATSLNELARDCGLGIALVEEMIPVRDAVRGACELLGLDPLHIANEGQFLAVVAPEYANAALNALNMARGGQDAQMIGEVREQPSGAVLVTTRYGGSRIIDMLVGDPLPRIC